MFVLTVAGWGSSFTVRRALAPVDSIVARVRDIQAHRLGERLDVRADSDELDRLVTTLNAMLDRMETSVSTRAPLRGRRVARAADADCGDPRHARDGRAAGSRRPTTGAASPSMLLDDLDRLSELVRDLRLIALAEAGHLLDEREPVPLAELVQDCCEMASMIADAQQIRVEAGAARRGGRQRQQPASAPRGPQPAAECDSLLAGGRVGAACRSAAPTGWRRSSSATRAAASRAVDLPHIFEPFYRSDPARARDTGGSGLGLAIVDQIVRAHGGRVDVTSTPEHGLDVLGVPAAGRCDSQRHLSSSAFFG